MEYKKLLAILENIHEFYKNDGHFVSETNGKEEREAITIVITLVKLYEKYLKKWGKND